MTSYEKPIVLENEDLAEGIYAASGAVDDGYSEVTGSEPEPSESSSESNDTDPGETTNTNTTQNDLKCDSQYMQGVWQAPDYSPWGPEGRGYKQQFACLGCPANTGSGCGLQTHYVDSGNAESYNVDNGNRMPSWEKKGYGPDDAVTDWAM